MCVCVCVCVCVSNKQKKQNIGGLSMERVGHHLFNRNSQSLQHLGSLDSCQDATSEPTTHTITTDQEVLHSQSLCKQTKQGK